MHFHGSPSTKGAVRVGERQLWKRRNFWRERIVTIALRQEFLDAT